MQYSQGELGRIFVLRLETGEIIHECIESFADMKNIKYGSVIIVGGADKESKLVVGPENGDAEIITPMTYVLNGANEINGTGTIFPDESGKSTLHLHISCGRQNQTITGCIRTGVKAWCVCEIVIQEMLYVNAVRKTDPETGFKLLELN